MQLHWTAYKKPFFSKYMGFADTVAHQQPQRTLLCHLIYNNCVIYVNVYYHI